MVVKVDEIASPERSPGHMKRTRPEVFARLGCMPEEYEIKLREGVTPFNLTTSHNTIATESSSRIKADGRHGHHQEDSSTHRMVVVIPKKKRQR